MLTLEVKERDLTTSPARIREAGLIPAVLYGPKEAPIAVSIDERRLQQVWREAGHTAVVTIAGAGESKETLIHEVQAHPVSGRLLHADFYVLEKGKKVRIAVPLEFAGQAPAEKVGHIVVKALHQLEIEVAPADLPHKLEVDLGRLENVGDRVLASDIVLPASASLITNGEEIVASVTEFKEEKEAAPAPAAAAPAEGAESAAAPAQQ
jgi:large subunit ribosomal protein L25